MIAIETAVRRRGWIWRAGRFSIKRRAGPLGWSTHRESKSLNLVVFLPVCPQPITRGIGRVRHRAGTGATVTLHRTSRSAIILISFRPGVPQYPSNSCADTPPADH